MRRTTPKAGFLVLAEDLQTEQLLAVHRPSNTTVLALATLEVALPELRACRGSRSSEEYTATAVPALLHLVVNQAAAGQPVLYLTPEAQVYSSLLPIWEELGVKAVLLHPHRFSPGLESSLRYGTYYSGFVALRAGAEAARGEL